MFFGVFWRSLSRRWVFVRNFACDSDHTADIYSRTVASELDYFRYRIVGFGDLGLFFRFFDEVCQEHEFLLVILRVIVTKLQTHILQTCTTRTFHSMTFRRIRFKIIVIDTNCPEMSFHEAVKGYIIRCFHGVSPLCRCGNIRVRNLSILPHIQLYTQSPSTDD